MSQFGTIPNTEFADITGALGVGAITMMSVFLCLDATSNVFQIVEENAKSASWAVFVALPIIVTSYVLGILMTVFGSVIRKTLGMRTPIEVHSALQRHQEIKENIEYEYRQFAKKREILEGMIPTSAFTGIAIWLEAQAWGFQQLGIGLVLFAFVGALTCPLFARIIEGEFAEMLFGLTRSAS